MITKINMQDNISAFQSKDYDIKINKTLQVNHYLNYNSRIISIQNSYDVLKNKGIFITFENFSPFTTMGEDISLDRWKEYQFKQGKSLEKASRHIN